MLQQYAGDRVVGIFACSLVYNNSELLTIAKEFLTVTKGAMAIATDTINDHIFLTLNLRISFLFIMNLESRNYKRIQLVLLIIPSYY